VNQAVENCVAVLENCPQSSPARSLAQRPVEPNPPLPRSVGDKATTGMSSA
jgi:hypothetical protein